MSTPIRPAGPPAYTPAQPGPSTSTTASAVEAARATGAPAGEAPGGLRARLGARRAQNRRDDPLRHAVANRNATLVTAALQRGAQGDTLHYRMGLVPTGRAAVHIAAGPDGNRQLMETLLDHGANPAVGTASGKNTALHVAVKSGNQEVVNLLVDRAPELLTIPNKRTQTPLALAEQRVGQTRLQPPDVSGPARTILQTLRAHAEQPDARRLDQIPVHERQATVTTVPMERVPLLDPGEVQAGLPYFTGPQLSELNPAALGSVPPDMLGNLGVRALSLTQSQWDVLDNRQRDAIVTGFRHAWNQRAHTAEEIARMPNAEIEALERMGMAT